MQRTIESEYVTLEDLKLSGLPVETVTLRPQSEGPISVYDLFGAHFGTLGSKCQTELRVYGKSFLACLVDFAKTKAPDLSIVYINTNFGSNKREKLKMEAIYAPGTGVLNTDLSPEVSGLELLEFAVMSKEIGLLVVCDAVPYSTSDDTIRMYVRPESMVIATELMEEIARKAAAQPASQLYLILPGIQGSLRMKGIAIPEPEFQIEPSLVYGEAFSAWDERTVAQLTTGKKGIVMIHGPPGTGKTSWIRSLSTRIPAKRVLFVSPSLAARLDSPEMTNLLLQQSEEATDQKLGGLILVIEDAELFITKRDKEDSGRSAAVSMILNLTDGLMNDALSVQIIVSFNTALADIDAALTRKGRMLSEREFGLLDVKAAKKLADAMEKELPPIEHWEGKQGWSAASILVDREEEDGPTKKMMPKRTGF